MVQNPSLLHRNYNWETQDKKRPWQSTTKGFGFLKHVTRLVGFHQDFFTWRRSYRERESVVYPPSADLFPKCPQCLGWTRPNPEPNTPRVAVSWAERPKNVDRLPLSQAFQQSARSKCSSQASAHRKCCQHRRRSTGHTQRWPHVQPSEVTTFLLSSQNFQCKNENSCYWIGMFAFTMSYLL